MIPSDFRLEAVVARLIERLEGTRRSYVDAKRAEAEFGRIAEEHLAAVLSDYRENPVGENEGHGDFLRREVTSTFLPRYTRIASAMTEREEGGYGLGFVHGIFGRLLLIGAALLAVLGLERTGFPVVLWVGLPLCLGIPFLPDVVRMAVRAQYRRELESVVADMQRIQAQTVSYGSPPLPRELTGETNPSGNKRPQNQSERGDP